MVSPLFWTRDHQLIGRARIMRRGLLHSQLHRTEIGPVACKVNSGPIPVRQRRARANESTAWHQAKVAVSGIPKLPCRGAMKLAGTQIGVLPRTAGHCRAIDRERGL